MQKKMAMTMRTVFPAATVCALLTFVAAATTSAAPTHGAIRICRTAGITELMDHRSVPIPAGTGFTNGMDSHGDDLKPSFTAVTTKAVTLPPKPACVVAPAEMKENPTHFHLTTKYGHELASQLMVPGLSVVGRVSSDFPE